MPAWEQVTLGFAAIVLFIWLGFLLWILLPLRLSEPAPTVLRFIGLGIFLIGLVFVWHEHKFVRAITGETSPHPTRTVCFHPPSDVSRLLAGDVRSPIDVHHMDAAGAAGCDRACILSSGTALWTGIVGGGVLFLYRVIPILQTESAFGRVYAAYGGIFIILSILWGMVFDGWRPDRFDLIGAVFALIGVTVAAAQKSQPDQPLYAVRTWSAQMLHQQDKMQISGRVEQRIQTQSRIHEPEITQPHISEQAEETIQTQSSLHEAEIIQTPQSPAPLDVCHQPETNGQCESDQDTGADHANDHPHQDHGNDRNNHENDRTEHGHGDH